MDSEHARGAPELAVENKRIRRRFDSWQNALNDSDLTVRDCQMRRAMFQAEIEEAYKAGRLIAPTPAALAASPEVAALIREAEARGMERAAGMTKSQADVLVDAGVDAAQVGALWTATAAIRAEAAALRGEKEPK